MTVLFFVCFPDNFSFSSQTFLLFFGKILFTFTFFFNRRSGRPFSYAYEDDTVEEYFGDSDDESSRLDEAIDLRIADGDVGVAMISGVVPIFVDPYLRPDPRPDPRR